MQVDVGAARDRRVEIRLAPGLERFHRAIQQVAVHRKSHLVDLSALRFAQQFAGAADFKIVRSQRKPNPQFFQRGNRLQTLERIAAQRGARRDQQVGVGAVV